MDTIYRELLSYYLRGAFIYCKNPFEIADEAASVNIIYLANRWVF